MVRLEDWQRRFANYLISKQNEPFVWGKNDCVLFGAGALESITGVNLYAGQPKYKTEMGAKKLLKKLGGIEKLLIDRLGSGHRNALLARRGDIVLVKAPLMTVGVVDDTGQRIALVYKDGLIRVPLTSAWRVWSY